ncbi:hypothetical protein D049_3927A, partial [Vibrio parahaemolyticus VPTS-2010]
MLVHHGCVEQGG